MGHDNHPSYEIDENLMPGGAGSKLKNIIPLRDTVKATLQRWPWILASLTFFLFLGAAYILITPKTYTQTASMVIKQDGEGASAAMLGDLQSLGLFSSNNDVENELETFKSPDLMEEVVDYLDLSTTYYKPGKFHDTVIFGTSLPVKVSLPGLSEKSSCSFKIEVTPKGEVTLSKLAYLIPGPGKKKKIKSNKEYKGKLGAPIMTEVGAITVNPTQYYKPTEKDMEIVVDRDSRGSTIRSFESRLAADIPNKKSTVIRLTFNDPNLERADSVLAGLIAAYNNNWIEDKNIAAAQASRFIDERLNVIEKELGGVDSDISNYKSENLVPDVAMTASAAMQSEQKLTQDILGLTGQLQSLYKIRASISKEGAYETLPANTGLTDLAIERQITTYNQKITERNRLLAQTSDKNPLVKILDKDIAGLSTAIHGSVDNSIRTLESQIGTLQSARAQETSKLAATPTQAKNLLQRERQQKVKENLYLFLLQRREDNQLNQSFTSYNNRVIIRPGGDPDPTKPKVPLIMGACFVLGFICPFLTTYVLETLNTKVRGRDDVKGLRTPMIGEIPEVPAKEMAENENEPLVRQGKRDIVNEAFRVLRTNINFARVYKHQCNVLGITSFNPGSGKTFISFNVSVAFALRNKRVLLIDADMRKSATSKYVGNPKKGLSDYLNGDEKDVRSLLVSVEGTPSLQVLPSGKLPPAPTELIERPEFGKMIEELRPDYDLILIDCPPIDIVADAKIVNEFVDRMIFVMRVGVMERSMVKDLDELANAKEYKKMAFILNGVPLARNSFGKIAYSSYSYAYGN
ncbi:MAG: polysaccharide biosynthesis tyrosine autokinase [Candidatus Amulumruptor caecigallinarius]|nr:polysaccharide biosynthesis tyrosine autokinase [Candidatus Amulumruptor caecigallinarius]